MEECIIIFCTTILIKQFMFNYIIDYVVHIVTRCTLCMCLLIKGIRIQSQFFFVEKSILCVKITVSPQKCFESQFYILYRPFNYIVTIMSHILING